jgi:hypothetical protein
MANAYAETQAAGHMITTAAAITLYKMHCRSKIPASAVETVNKAIREYGESRVVASMAEMGMQREKLGHVAFCVRVEKTYLKKISSASAVDCEDAIDRSFRCSSLGEAGFLTSTFTRGIASD